jgi:hypothetical protein
MIIEEENIIWIPLLPGVVETVHHCPENLETLGVISSQEGYAINHGNRDGSRLGNFFHKTGRVVTYTHEIISSA